MFNSSILERSKIKNIQGAVVNDYLDQTNICPAWRRGMSNTVWSSSSVDGDGGDRVISGYEVDGDLLLTVGWGDGFAVRRLNDDGTMTKLFHDDNALYRDTTITYNHIVSIAIHKPSKKAVIMTMNVNGYSIIDYSDTTNIFIEPRPSSQYFIDTEGVKIDRAGNYYDNGLVCAGDWIYVGDYEATHYKKYPRRNIVTGVEEIVDGTTQYVAGSKVIDRNGYRCELKYDEINDRVYYFTFYNANFTVILNASTATPEVLFVDMNAAGMGDDSYEQGLYIEDPVNKPNVVFVANYNSIVEVDYTDCFSGLAPQVIGRTYTELKYGQKYSVYFRFGTKSQLTDGDLVDKAVGYPRFMPTSSDRGRNLLDGWVDLENNNLVGFYRHDYITEDTTTLGRGRSYRSDYGHPVFRMKSTNGTPYWVKVGYGYDGHGFRVWDDTIGNLLIDNYEVEYGDFTLPNSSMIGKVFISGMDDYFIPSGCSLTTMVSNDGVTWETYNSGEQKAHIFNTEGNTLAVKFIANGYPDKVPYKIGKPLMVHYSTASRVERESNTNYKVTRKRLVGKKPI